MSSLSRKFVRHIYQMEYDLLPPEVVKKAKLCLLHALACTFAGYKSRWSVAAVELVKELGNQGESSVWFHNHQTNAAEAAFANAVMAQSILHEDIHRESNAHPGIIVIPTALAVGEQYNSSGKQILLAIVAGYEAMGRLGRAISTEEFGKRGFRPTSIIGTFGSGLAAGKLIGLDEDQLVSALGLAGNFTSGVNEWAFAGTDDLYFQNGSAARSGIIAAYLAKKGIVAPESILEGRAGICRSYGLSKDELEKANLNDGKYEIMDVLFKPAPACALVQTTAQIALDIARAGIKPSDIQEGVIKTFSLGKTYPGCDHPGPFKGIIQARMSNQYNFAAVFIRQSLSDDVYQDYRNDQITELARRMRVEVDDNIDRLFPKFQPVEIELYLKNGQRYQFYKDQPVYLERNDIIENWLDDCSKHLGKEVVRNIVDIVENLEAVENMKELTNLLKTPQ